MDDIIKISNINDFIFCPASIYFHNLYGNENKLMFQSKYQLNGTKAHETVDENKYSTKAEIITALDVYSGSLTLYFLLSSTLLSSNL